MSADVIGGIAGIYFLLSVCCWGLNGGYVLSALVQGACVAAGIAAVFFGVGVVVWLARTVALYFGATA